MKLKFSNPLQGVARCPQCNVSHPLLTSKWQEVIRVKFSPALAATWGAYECSNCNRITLAEGIPVTVDQYGRLPDGGTTIRSLYPTPTSVDASLPTEAQRYLRQAMETRFAPDASIVMAASAVDAMLKEKGYVTGSLYSRIDQAVTDHVLTEGMAKWAHKVRLEANAVRHADQETSHPTEDDAKQLVDFASALGDFLYVFTARVEEGIKVSDSPS